MAPLSPKLASPAADTADFDPYRDWLGTQSSEPNHYELLGLAEFDADPQRILRAYEQRFQQIRRYEVGTKSETAIKILRRLSTAYIELTDLKRKETYDRQLRQSSGRETDVAVAEDLPDNSAVATGEPIVEEERPAPEAATAKPRVVPPPRPKTATQPALEPRVPTPAAVDAEQLQRLLMPLQPTTAKELETSLWPPDSADQPHPADGPMSPYRPQPTATEAAMGGAESPLVVGQRPHPLPASARRARGWAASSNQDGQDVVRHLGVGLAALALIPLLPLLSLSLLVMGIPVLLLVGGIKLSIAGLLALKITVIRGPWLALRMLCATPRLIDRVLCALAGPENRIVLNFLRFWCVVLVLTLVGWYGWLAWNWMLGVPYPK